VLYGVNVVGKYIARCAPLLPSLVALAGEDDVLALSFTALEYHLGAALALGPV
jgi:hypothetical protein